MKVTENKEKRILAIDTSTPACSVALQYDGQIISDFYQEKSRHTDVILVMINKLLKQAGIDAKMLEGIIISAGPGAFTGLRVGAAVASALAIAADCEVGLLSSLALQTASVQFETTQKVMPAFDARMEQCYYGFYQGSQSGIELLSPDALAAPEDVDETILSQADIIIGSGICFEKQWQELTKADFIDDIPLAENAFKCLSLINWQAAYEPIDLRYLRNKVTG